MKAIAYLRVSTEDQKQNGISIAAQEERIRQYAGLYGHELIEIISDAGLSAKNLHRPGIQRIIDLMTRREIGAVIVSKLDRLTRSVRDLADIIDLSNRTEVALISVAEHIDTGSAAGRMVVNMIGVISQWEREAIGERTSAALQYKKHTGQVYNAHALYGYENRENGELVECPNEQQIILIILHLREQRYSFKAIADELNARGIETRSGNPWGSEQIRRIVKHADDRRQIGIAQEKNKAA